MLAWLLWFAVWVCLIAFCVWLVYGALIAALAALPL